MAIGGSPPGPMTPPPKEVAAEYPHTLDLWHRCNPPSKTTHVGHQFSADYAENTLANLRTSCGD